MFTRDQIEEIKKKLIMLGTKDTQFPDAHKLNGEEIIAIVQDGENKKIPLSSIINDDFINVSKDTTEILTLSTAVSKIDINNRKLGQVITFKDSANSWAIRQFTGSSLDNWNDVSLWKSISGIDELKSQVETNAEDISVLSDEIERHDASILNLGTDVSKLKDKDIETSSSLSELTTRVDTLKSQADTNTSNISSINTEVSALHSKVDVNTTSISQINNTIAGHEESIAQINNTLAEHTESINANITTDRIEDGAVASEKIATSAFDSTLSVSGKIAPANVVGKKLTELEGKTHNIVHEGDYTDEEEQIWQSDDSNENYASIGNYGIKAKKFLNLDGTPAIPNIDSAMPDAPEDSSVPSTKMMKGYVDEHGIGKLPISKEEALPTDDFIEVQDDDGNVVTIFTKQGIRSAGYFYLDGTPFDSGNDWRGKVLTTYGDSVTAINGGNHIYPFSNDDIKGKWGVRVADYFKMSAHYGRGIGGQCFTWGENSGSVTWVDKSGVMINRKDGFNFDNFDGASYPTGVTAAMEASGDAIRIRGCGCSWLRITKMYPESIKDTIDCILIMYHNDAGHTSGTLQWSEGKMTDTEWAASSYYNKYGGDYNIETVKGGIASTIMKLQAWMPQAVLILCTPISGRGTTGALKPTLTDTDMEHLANDVREISTLMSIPCIDVYHNDGINGLNRTDYITDTIHPYTEGGKMMVARAMIGGMKNILPML